MVNTRQGSDFRDLGSCPDGTSTNPTLNPRLSKALWNNKRLAEHDTDNELTYAVIYLT